jgi:hypothetical protein
MLSVIGIFTILIYALYKKKEIQRDDPLKHLLINETFREYKLKTIRELGIFIKNRNTLSKKSILYEHVLFSILETI